MCFFNSAIWQIQFIEIGDNKCIEKISTLHFILLCDECVYSFQCQIQLDRKVLTDIAIYEPRTFQVIKNE